jgi:hypothetical protein
VDAAAVREWPRASARDGADEVAPELGPTLDEVRDWTVALSGWSAALRLASEAQEGWDAAHARLRAKAAELEGPVPRHLFEDTVWGAVTRFDTRAREATGEQKSVDAGIGLTARDAVLNATMRLIFARWIGAGVAAEAACAEALDEAMDQLGHYMREHLGVGDACAIYNGLMRAIPVPCPFDEALIREGRRVLGQRQEEIGARPSVPTEPVLARAYVDGHELSSLTDRAGQRRVTLEVARARVRRAALGLVRPDE